MHPAHCTFFPIAIGSFAILAPIILATVPILISLLYIGWNAVSSLTLSAILIAIFGFMHIAENGTNPRNSAENERSLCFSKKIHSSRPYSNILDAAISQFKSKSSIHPFDLICHHVSHSLMQIAEDFKTLSVFINIYLYINPSHIQ